jgi:hypothetical protein
MRVDDPQRLVETRRVAVGLLLAPNILYICTPHQVPLNVRPQSSPPPLKNS